MFKHLFTPLKFGKTEVRNRIVMLPITTGYTEVDETIGDRFINFFAERAKGGVGLIIIPFAPVAGGSPLEPGLFDDRFIPGVHRLTTAIHSYGAKVAAQLMVSYNMVFNNGVPEVVGPSPIMNQMIGVVPRVLTVNEIHYLVEEYGKSAKRAREGGFDAVEVLVGGGYLLNRFLSPISNQREDEYGGSLERRMRIILDVIQSIKTKAGNDFPISVRLNTDEQMTGGHTIEDSKWVAQGLEKAGVNIINIYTGWHESQSPTIAPSVPPGAFAHLAEKIKNCVSIPVIAANRINSPIVAEKILAEKKADFVGMARALLADPELPNKAKEGRADEINPCIACSKCLSEILSTYRSWGKGAAAFCTVNPVAGKEGEYILRPAEKKKKVIVIGGGPAGMEAAMTAAVRGHRVTLYEKGKEPGGWLLVGCIPPYKSEIKTLYESLTVRIKKAGVQIRLSTEATPETVENEKPDVLILALGANPMIPNIPGAKGSLVVIAEDLLTGRKKISGSIIIIGGGLVGCETAEFLIEQGKDITRVTVIEMLERMANTVSSTYRPFFLARLRNWGIKMKTGTIVEEITNEGVRVNQQGTSGFIKGDAVVLAVGLESEKKHLDSFWGKAHEIYTVGDCVKPRTIQEAIEEGFIVGMKI
jgi:2,4-dienoyl-CoA reductase-like NADH-dependent reductase (Old Yellow Enzyme family)/thioredoxin reductase